jgi:hypothetical protein
MEQIAKENRTAPESTIADRTLILVTQNQTLMQQQSLMLNNYREACNQLTFQQQTIDNLKERLESLESSIPPIPNCVNEIKMYDNIVNTRDLSYIKCHSFQESPLITKVANLGQRKRSFKLANFNDDSLLDLKNENDLIVDNNLQSKSINNEIMIWDEPSINHDHQSMNQMTFNRKNIMVKAIAQNLEGTGYILHGNYSKTY